MTLKAQLLEARTAVQPIPLGRGRLSGLSGLGLGGQSARLYQHSEGTTQVETRCFRRAPEQKSWGAAK